MSFAGPPETWQNACMQRLLRHGLMALPLAALISGAHLTAQSTAGPWKLGQPAPHLHLPILGSSAQANPKASGGSLDLSDYLGQRVLLIEFASW